MINIYYFKPNFNSSAKPKYYYSAPPYESMLPQQRHSVWQFLVCFLLHAIYIQSLDSYKVLCMTDLYDSANDTLKLN